MHTFIERARQGKWNKPVSSLPALSLVTAIISSLSATTLAGAWVPEEDKSYVKIGYQYYEANEFVGGDEDTDFDQFVGHNVSYYAEFGLGNNLALYGSLLAQAIEQTNTAGETINGEGLGDAEVGVRYQWFAEPFVLSTSFLVKLPFLYDEGADLALGNGQTDYEGRVLFGKSLYPYGYVGFEFGYRFRVDEPSDEYRYLAEYGFNANENLYFRTKIDAIQSVGNADVVDSTQDNLALGPEFDIVKWELTAGWNFDPKHARQFDRWGMEFTYTKEMGADNTIQGDGYQVALTRSF